MSTIRVDTITDEAGTGAPNFPSGINVSGGAVTGIDTNPLKYTAVSGATQALDVGSYNFFDAGTLTADTTVSFSNVPTEARWTYTFEPATDPTTGYSVLALEALDLIPLPSVGTALSLSLGSFLSPDETKYYLTSWDNSGRVYQYDLGTAGDFTSAVYNSKFYSLSAQEGQPQCITFSADGSKMYVGGNTRSVYQYNLSTSWDVTTASYVSSYNTSDFDAGSAKGLAISSDGTRLYVSSNSSSVRAYALSTPYVLSSGSISSTITTSASVAEDIYFTPDGSAFFVSNTESGPSYKYTMSTPWNISTASLSETSTASSAGGGNIFFSQSGAIFNGTTRSGSIRPFLSGTLYTMTMPNSIENPPSGFFSKGNIVSYTFFTADGGTTVKLINEEVL